jgi:hypothetical protein
MVKPARLRRLLAMMTMINGLEASHLGSAGNTACAPASTQSSVLHHREALPGRPRTSPYLALSLECGNAFLALSLNSLKWVSSDA